MSIISKRCTNFSPTLTPRYINPRDVNNEGIVRLAGAVNSLLHSRYADPPGAQVPKAGCEPLKATHCLPYWSAALITLLTTATATKKANTWGSGMPGAQLGDWIVLTRVFYAFLEDALTVLYA